jgi:hypothetical protein
VDTGRGMVGDILPDRQGLETWAVSGTGLWTADGQFLGTATPGTNQSIRWAADMTTQIVNGALEATPTIDDWRRGRLLTADGTRTNNGTKGNPGLAADILGDWREEMLVRTADSSAIRIHLSTELTDRKLYTLMHDPQYRADVARQQTTYNQPAYLSFYFGSDLDWSRVPLPDLWTPGGVDALRDRLDQYVTSGDVAGPIVWRLRAALTDADRHLEDGDARRTVDALERFTRDLRRPARPDTVSDAARSALTHQANTVITMLS